MGFKKSKSQGYNEADAGTERSGKMLNRLRRRKPE
jgi:hypothetical protein